MNEKNILKVDNLSVSFSMYKGFFKKENLEVLHSLSLEVNSGEVVAVVGSSGSGKSILAHAVMGLLPKNAHMSGNITYRGEKFDEIKRSELLGRKISFVPQSVDYLDPVMKVGKQVQGVYSTKKRQEDLFGKYHLDKNVEEMYPFQLSGGMARRVLVSSAMMESPELIIADEPTPGLSVEMAMETLNHFREMADNGAGVLLITHDIDLALNVADKIAVFYAGTIIEIADTRDFINGGIELRHPYSRAFISALPQNEFRAIEGVQPYAGIVKDGCSFANRCPNATDKCCGEIPIRSLRSGKVRCINAT